jgi:hypothetical protein
VLAILCLRSRLAGPNADGHRSARFPAARCRLGHRGDAVDDDEERIRRVADLRDGGPHRHLDDPGELRNATQLILVELTEEGDALANSIATIPTSPSAVARSSRARGST